MERLDKLSNGFLLYQNKAHFCFGIDAVLLANFAKASISSEVVDLCSGNGIVPILMQAVNKGKHFSAVEVQDEVFDLLERNVKVNKLDEKINAVKGDIKQVSSFFERRFADVVTVNPPYMKNEPSEYLDRQNEIKKIARHEVLCNVYDVVKAVSYILKPNGKLFMVHRPDRLSEIFSALKEFNMEPKRIQFVAPSLGKSANIVLIEATPGAKPDLKFEPELYVYTSDREYTEEIKKIRKRVELSD